MKAVLVALVVTLAASRGAAAQSTAPVGTTESGAGWFELQLPGSFAGLARAAGLDPDTQNQAGLALEIIRTVHQVVGRPAPYRLVGHLSTLGRLRAALEAAGSSPLSLRMADNDAERSRLESLLEALGLRLSSTKGSPPRVLRDNNRETARLREFLVDGGVKLDGIEDRLNRGETVVVKIPMTTIPLPVNPQWWNGRVGPIFIDQKASFLYYGLMSLDSPTRTYLAATPRFWEALVQNPALFAVYGGSFRIRKGAVDVPGGTDAIGFWESLVGEKVTQPDRFVNAVLSADSGRLAYFYDLIGHLDSARVKFAIGQFGTRTNWSLLQYVETLYGWFNVEDAAWDPTQRPFTRPKFDPSLLLMLIGVDENGKSLAPAWKYLWKAVFESTEIPVQPHKELRPTQEVADAPFLIEQVFSRSDGAPERLQTILFAQRVFSSVSEETAPDILVALRGFPRFRMLHLTLERMGIRVPAVYASGTKRAELLSSIPDPDVALMSISQFQGALSLLERARFSGRVSVNQVIPLVSSLFRLDVDRDGSYGAKVALWLENVLVPEIGAKLPAGDPVNRERSLLAGVSGLRIVIPPDDADPAELLIEWEGWRYRVDPAGDKLDRASKLRERQVGNSLDSILKLARVSAKLGSAGLALEDVPTQASVIKELQNELTQPTSPTRLTDAQPTELRRSFDDALRELGRIRDRRRLKNAARVAQELERVTARLTADVLRAISYALQIRHVETNLFAGGDVSHAHDFGLARQRREEREAIVWGLPAMFGTRARGALLGLDVALVGVSLRQVSTSLRTHAPVWTEPDQTAYQWLVPLFNPLSANGAGTIAAALQKGRERVARMAMDPAESEEIVEATNLGPLRRSLLTWTIDRDPAGVTRFFSHSELLRIAGDNEALRAAEDWSAPAISLTGCLCLALGPALDWDLFAGRMGASGFLGARSPDLLLKLSEILVSLNLPTAIADDIVPIAVQSALDEARPSDIDDWWALVRHTQDISTRVVEDYVSSVTAGHSMVAVSAVVK